METEEDNERGSKGKSNEEDSIFGGSMNSSSNSKRVNNRLVGIVKRNTKKYILKQTLNEKVKGKQ